MKFLLVALVLLSPLPPWHAIPMMGIVVETAAETITAAAPAAMVETAEMAAAPPMAAQVTE